jgi:D-ribose pyranose/furanose isomerase RbsD
VQEFWTVERMVTLALEIGVPFVTVVVFFLRMDWQIGRAVDLLRDMKDSNTQVMLKLDKLDRRIERLSQQRQDSGTS